MSHDGFSGRCKDLAWGSCAENVAWNTYGLGDSEKKVMVAWYESPGHKANIMNGKYNAGGVGYYECPDGKVYYTAMFTAK